MPPMTEIEDLKKKLKEARERKKLFSLLLEKINFMAFSEDEKPALSLALLRSYSIEDIQIEDLKKRLKNLGENAGKGEGKMTNE